MWLTAIVRTSALCACLLAVNGFSVPHGGCLRAPGTGQCWNSVSHLHAISTAEANPEIIAADVLLNKASEGPGSVGPMLSNSGRAFRDFRGPLVIVNPENVEFSAGMLGAVVGYIVGGFWSGAVVAMVANIGSKHEYKYGSTVRGLGKSAIESLNILNELNAEYNFVEKAATSIESGMENVKTIDKTKTIHKIEALLTTASSKATQLNEDYDVLAKVKDFLGVVSDITDAIVVKAIDLEEEYNLVDKMRESAGHTMKKLLLPDKGDKYQ